MLDLPPCVDGPVQRTAFYDALIDAGAAAIRHARGDRPATDARPAREPGAPVTEPSLKLALTMVPDRKNNLALALVDPATGRELEVVELSTHNSVETTEPGKALVTVTVYADIVAPAVREELVKP